MEPTGSSKCVEQQTQDNRETISPMSIHHLIRAITSGLQYNN